MRLLKILVGIVVLAFLALTGYAYLGDMAPRQQDMRQPVRLDTGASGAAPAAPAPVATGTSAPDNAAPETTAETPAIDGAQEADPNGLD